VTDEYDAVVYDLDGTLVRLAVDWQQVERDVADRLRAAGVDPEPHDMWEMLDAAEDAGIGDAVHDVIATHEREGATRAERLPGADELPTLDVPTAVCSLNCEAACRIALEIHGLDRHVDTIVGRDTTATYKPDPEPLLYAIQSLGVSPAKTLFIGDSESDELTADRAGVDFQYVSERL
jgi:phosphoglycolate phosphatase-like HAD superfamily hydrolase